MALPDNMFDTETAPGAFPLAEAGALNTRNIWEDEPKVELVAIMGATGSGKSSFINLLLEPETKKVEVGHDLDSCTANVEAIPFNVDGFHGSIIDTPGFDDTYLTDTAVLRRISDWMDMTYRQGVKITGILYLRDITEARMRGSSLKNLAMFRKLCGTSSLANVVFLTTKWDMVSNSEGERREAQLISDHLKLELTSGARTARHDNTRESAVDALRMVLGHEGVALQLQKQLVDEGMSLRDTDAGAAIAQDLDAMRVEHVETIHELGEEIQNATAEENEELKNVLAERLAKVEELLQKVQADKALLEMDRAREVLAYQKKLDDVARNTGQSVKGVVSTGLLSGLVSVTPLILQEWQAWTALRESRRAQEDELNQKRWEQQMSVEKRRLELENEVAREKEVLMLRQETEAYRAQNKIPILDLLALPDVQALLEKSGR